MRHEHESIDDVINELDMSLLDRISHLTTAHRDAQIHSLRELSKETQSPNIQSECQSSIESYEEETLNLSFFSVTDEINDEESENQEQEESEPSIATLETVTAELESLRHIDEALQKHLANLSHQAASNAEKKAIADVLHNTKKFNDEIYQIGIIAALMITGIGLTVGTLGAGTAAGSALILEGFDRIHELIKHPEHATYYSSITEIIEKIAHADEREYLTLNALWIRNIETHCDEQIKALAHIKKENKDDAKAHIEIDTLETLYTTHKAAIQACEKIHDEKEKMQAIKKIAQTIEQKEKAAESIIDKLPKKTHAREWGIRAKHFYHENKKMIQFAGLFALTAIGLGLSIATGGIAAAIGAAALGVVGISGTRQIIKTFINQDFLHTKKPHYFKKNPSIKNHDIETLVHKQQKHIVDHCERQEQSLQRITDDLPKSNYAHLTASLDERKEEYNHGVRSCLHLQEEDQQKQLSSLHLIADSIQKTDEKAKTTLKMTGNSSSTVTKEVKRFFNRAENFAKDNKKAAENIGKFLLATTALATIVALSSPIGFAAVLGFGFLAWGISSLAKKAAQHLHIVNQKNQKIEDQADHETEGETKSNKEELNMDHSNKH